METDECCRQILRAVASRERDLVMTWRGKVGRILKLISPRLVDDLARRAIASCRGSTRRPFSGAGK